MALQHAQAISILRRAVVVGEGSPRLGVLSEGLPLSLIEMLGPFLSLFDMLLVTRGGSGT